MRLRILAGALALVATSGAWAQVSLMDVYRQALDKDPQIAVQRLNQENAAVQVKSGLSNLLPSVNASAGWNTSSACNSSTEYQLSPDFENCQTTSAGVSLSQNLFALAAVDAYEALKLNASSVEIQTESAMQDLMVRVAEAYLNVLRAQDARDSIAAQLAAVERQFEQTEQRYEVGLVTVTDVMDAQATLDETRVGLIQASNSADIALQNLSILTGETPDSILTLGDNLPIEMPADGGAQQWIDFALANHPDVLAAERGLASGEKELRARRNNRLPVLSASASINYQDDPTDGIDFDEKLGSSVGLTITVPLYTGGATQAQILSTGLSNNIAEQNLELLKRSISVQVTNLYRQVQSDVQNIQAQQQVVASRESALEATEVGYEVGTRNIVEVLNAQQALFQARQAYADARYNYVFDRLQLKKAAGQLSEADLSALEAYLVAP
ncbi:TolC family outer membrane protein [Saccharospirillum mangrovi]|uniref:TolC family outer membrane protein n=1 Tax=Saccharospirillum mangrovi TaxID=2161747 RepID=UPI000D381D6F|nr:TolC family outer membrane protein [Saccharospirillum mangrovi]